jgi:hypothetical protein
MKFVVSDGGRKAAGFPDCDGDCVVRALANALDKPYAEMYHKFNNYCQANKHRWNVESVDVEKSVPIIFLRMFFWDCYEDVFFTDFLPPPIYCNKEKRFFANPNRHTGVTLADLPYMIAIIKTKDHVTCMRSRWILDKKEIPEEQLGKINVECYWKIGGSARERSC